MRKLQSFPETRNDVVFVEYFVICFHATFSCINYHLIRCISNQYTLPIRTVTPTNTNNLLHLRKPHKQPTDKIASNVILYFYNVTNVQYTYANQMI